MPCRTWALRTFRCSTALSCSRRSSHSLPKARPPSARTPKRPARDSPSSATRTKRTRTPIVHRGNVDEIVPALGLPCVLKLPDSGFGLDVVKIESEESLRKEAERFFNQSELLIAQEWLPSDFDWRVGVYDRRPLFVAKYFMAPGHWKVIKVVEGQQEVVEGKTEAMTIGEAPEQVINTAVRAANLIGGGLYGAD